MSQQQASSSSQEGTTDLQLTLFRIFLATLSPEKSTRQGAEEALQSLTLTHSDLVIHLLELATQPPSVCASIHGTSSGLTNGALLAAAIRARNQISKYDWNRAPSSSSPAATTFVWTEEVKNRVRQHLVPLQCQAHVSAAIRRQLLAATTHLIDVDYPSRWPDLLPQVNGLIDHAVTSLQGVAATSSNELIDGEVNHMMLSQMQGALSVLRGCCKWYENPVHCEEKEGEDFASTMVPSLVSLTGVLLGWWRATMERQLGSAELQQQQMPHTSPSVFEFSAALTDLSDCLRLAQKSMFSLCSSRLPKCLCDVSAMEMMYRNCVIEPIQCLQNFILPTCAMRLTHFLRHPAMAGAPALQIRGDHFAEFQQSAVWKVYKWSMNLAYKLAQEFVNPKTCERRSRTVASFFSETYMCATTQAALDLVRWHASAVEPLALTSKASIMALEILTTAVEHKAAYTTVLLPHAEEIMTVLLFPRLAFTSEDEETWNDNPEEYVRKQTDPAGDVYSAKVVSNSCLLSLTLSSKKFHSKELFPALVNFLMNQLQAYVGPAAGATGDEDDLFTPAMEAARRVDATFYCLYQFKKVLAAMRFGDDKLEFVLTQYAVPLLRYPLGFLRARAVLALATFAPSLQWSSPEAYQAVLEPVLPLLNDEEPPVRVQACVCFSRLVCLPAARPVITPHIATLIQHYFNVMSMMDNEAVVRTLRKTISFYRDTLSQWALQLTDMLVAHFELVLQRVAKGYNEVLQCSSSPSSGVASASTSGAKKKKSRAHAEDGMEDGEWAAEGGEEDDGFVDVLMAAEELLVTLHTLVKALPDSPLTAMQRTSGEPLTAAQLSQDVFFCVQLRVAPMLFVILSHQGGSSYGFMDQSFSLLTMLLSRSPAVAPPTWKLIWCIHALMLKGGATDYFSQVLPPLDNFVSVDPRGFLFATLEQLTAGVNQPPPCEFGEPLPAMIVESGCAGQTPAQLTCAMAEAVLFAGVRSGPNGEDNLFQLLSDGDAAAAPKVLDALLQNYWLLLYEQRAEANSLVPRGPSGDAALDACCGPMEELIFHVVSRVLVAAGTRPNQTMTFRVLLANTVLSGLLASPSAALRALYAVQAAESFFAQYVQLLLSAPVSLMDGEQQTSVLPLLRQYDRSLFVSAVVACMQYLQQQPPQGGGEDAAMAAALQAGLCAVVQSGLLQQLAATEGATLSSEMRRLQRKIAKMDPHSPYAVAAASPPPQPSSMNGAEEADMVWEDDDEEPDDPDAELTDSDDEDWLNGDDDEDESEADDDDGEDATNPANSGLAGGDASVLQSLLRQARAARGAGGDKDDADIFLGERNLLAEEDEEEFSSPIEAVNAWAALVATVESASSSSSPELAAAGGAGSALGPVVELLTSAAGQVQASAIVQTAEWTHKIQEVRQAFMEALELKKNEKNK